MKSIPERFTKLFNQNITSLTLCWLVILKNQEKYGFSDSEFDFIFEGINFRSGRIKQNNDAIQNPQNKKFTIALEIDNKMIKMQDVLSDNFDNATIEIFLVDHSNLEEGKFILKVGYAGDIYVESGYLYMKICDKTELLNFNITKNFSKLCRAEFGDVYCKFNKSSLNVTVKILSVVAPNIIHINSIDNEKYYQSGFIIINNIRYGILKLKSGVCSLKEPLKYNPKSGESAIIEAGCTKEFSFCTQVYSNAVNFRGEPHVPSNIEILQ